MDLDSALTARLDPNATVKKVLAEPL